MKKIFFLFCLILPLMSAQNMNKKNKIFPFEYKKVVLDNGLKAILIPYDSPGLVSYYSVVRTGSRDEWEPGKSGFAHFFEHMMFRGTERFPGNVYDSIITSIGADANAYTDDDLTVYHLNFCSEELERVIDMEADRFQNLKYTKEQFQTESGAVYGEFRKGRINPWEVASEQFRDMAFTKHTYKHTTIGFETDIKNMPNGYEYSISFYNRYYRPSNVVIVVVGDFKEADATAWIKKYYSGWKGGYVPPKIEKEPKQTAPRAKEIQYSGKTLPLILLGYKNDGFDAKNKKAVALTCFADLAFGETSKLYKKLILDEQKVQAIFANPGLARDPYLFEIYCKVKAENDVQYVLGEIQKTVDEFIKKPVDKTTFDELKKKMKYEFLMQLDEADAVAGILPRYITMTGDIDVIDEFYTTLESLTPADLQQAVKYYFKKTNENLIVMKGSK